MPGGAPSHLHHDFMLFPRQTPYRCGGLRQRTTPKGMFLKIGEDLGLVQQEPNSPLAVGREPGRGHCLWSLAPGLLTLTEVLSLQEPSCHVDAIYSNVINLAPWKEDDFAVYANMPPFDHPRRTSPHQVEYASIVFY